MVTIYSNVLSSFQTLRFVFVLHLHNAEKSHCVLTQTCIIYEVSRADRMDHLGPFIVEKGHLLPFAGDRNNARNSEKSSSISFTESSSI